MILRLLFPNHKSSAAQNDRHPLSALFIGLLVSLQPGCQSTTQQSNAVRDLLVDRISWQPHPVGADSSRSSNQLQFAITNTSATTRYQQIKLGIDYYTKTGQRLGSDTTVADTLITPGTLVKFSNQRVGTVRLGTERADIRVLSATTD